MRTFLFAPLGIALCATAVVAQTAPHELRAREIYNELVKITPPTRQPAALPRRRKRRPPVFVRQAFQTRISSSTLTPIAGCRGCHFGTIRAVA
jgi:hypothetical protein